MRVICFGLTVFRVTSNDQTLGRAALLYPTASARAILQTATAITDMASVAQKVSVPVVAADTSNNVVQTQPKTVAQPRTETRRRRASGPLGYAVTHRVRYIVKYLLAPILYRHAPFGLAPERLAVYLNCLLDKAGVSGDVAEVGCNLAGTAIIASKIVQKFSPEKSYVCYDTFEGFLNEQFDADVSKGMPRGLRKYFSANSEKLVKRILSLHGRKEVILVKGDATKLRPPQLRYHYSVVLLDVDLSEPTHDILELFYPRLSSGGVILVDDCIQGNGWWKAIVGYKRFCAEHNLEEDYRYGFGVITKV